MILRKSAVGVAQAMQIEPGGECAAVPGAGMMLVITSAKAGQDDEEVHTYLIDLADMLAITAQLSEAGLHLLAGEVRG